jgi:hypothetical protein
MTSTSAPGIAAGGRTASSLGLSVLCSNALIVLLA